MRQRIPKVTPMMLREQPSQFVDVINRLIDEVNNIEK